MTFKKSIALLLSGSMLAAAALTGCGSDNTAAAVSNTAGKDLLDQIQARGSITVAMEGTWAPWTYHDENDELVGYDVEVAKLIANELGVDVNFVEGESLIMGIKGLAVSSGSACTSASLEPSYVLRALGRSDELAHSSLRMTIGRFTTEEEIDYAVATIRENVAKLRELSPLWEMYQDGVDLSTIQWAAH
mgnify:CR=1 FL=1